jgi:hypothetical protein
MSQAKRLYKTIRRTSEVIALLLLLAALAFAWRAM